MELDGLLALRWRRSAGVGGAARLVDGALTRDDHIEARRLGARREYRVVGERDHGLHVLQHHHDERAARPFGAEAREQRHLREDLGVRAQHHLGLQLGRQAIEHVLLVGDEADGAPVVLKVVEHLRSHGAVDGARAQVLLDVLEPAAVELVRVRAAQQLQHPGEEARLHEEADRGDEDADGGAGGERRLALARRAAAQREEGRVVEGPAVLRAKGERGRGAVREVCGQLRRHVDSGLVVDDAGDGGGGGGGGGGVGAGGRHGGPRAEDEEGGVRPADSRVGARVERVAGPQAV
eukprot:6862122-Prymnesium_polylepis.1